MFSIKSVAMPAPRVYTATLGARFRQSSQKPPLSVAAMAALIATALAAILPTAGCATRIDTATYGHIRTTYVGIVTVDFQQSSPSGPVVSEGATTIGLVFRNGVSA